MTKKITEILDYNKNFVSEELYKEFTTDKYPSEKIVIVTCMDTRLTELLTRAMGFKNGDVHLIKNAGGYIDDPYGETMKAILTSIYKMGSESVFIIGHNDCGVEHMCYAQFEDGVESKIEKMDDSFKADIRKWLCGFENDIETVISSVELVKNHKLIPEYIEVYGFMIDSKTGELSRVI